jgi:SAM-dependent methyltransferase
MEQSTKNPGRDANRLGSLYGENFYDRQMAASLASARKYLRHLWEYLQPNSVLDVGCGRGTWLRACRELGCNNLVGYDGPWNDQSKMVDTGIVFRGVDLNERFSPADKFDLAISLEVAEHLEVRYADRFVNSLAGCANSILFGAALVGQGGCNHINERMPSYWAHRFKQHDFVPFDLFRPMFWGDGEVCFWYRQNTFLYLRQGSAPYRAFKARGMDELADSAFMDCIHPELYSSKIADKSVMFKLDDLGRSVVRAFKRRIRRLAA